MAELPRAGWDDLARECDLWRKSRARPTLWWRDDDAVAVTPALAELRRLAGVPLALAVIPMAPAAPLADDLGAYIGDWRLASVLQHGVGHLNHAASGDKKSEFPATRDLAEMELALQMGRGVLRSAFGPRFLPVLTPPWNRIADAALPLLPRLGLRGLTRFDELPYGRRGTAIPGIVEINTQIDVIDWRGSRGFVGEGVALGRLAAHLAARRNGTCAVEIPTGILTHHLVHDTATWRFLENLQDWLARRGELDLFLDPPSLWLP
ncbi:hypothetical protein [Dongia sp.]|uniref:hypothetical protein n=1 Tax=Dongia sp. TaxID=1977262 RepID=UPI0035AFBB41